MENGPSETVSSESMNPYRAVTFLAILLLGDLSVGVVLGILSSCTWELMIPGDFVGILFLNTLLFILNILVIIGLVLGQFFLMDKTHFPFPSLERKHRIICCLASSILLLFFVFVGAWILFPYLRHGVWLSLSDSFNVFLQVITNTPPSSSPFWQDIIEDVFGGGTEQLNSGIWFVGTCLVTFLCHYLFLDSLLEPQKTTRFRLSPTSLFKKAPRTHHAQYNAHNKAQEHTQILGGHLIEASTTRNNKSADR